MAGIQLSIPWDQSANGRRAMGRILPFIANWLRIEDLHFLDLEEAGARLLAKAGDEPRLRHLVDYTAVSLACGHTGAGLLELGVLALDQLAFDRSLGFPDDRCALELAAAVYQLLPVPSEPSELVPAEQLLVLSLQDVHRRKAQLVSSVRRALRDAWPRPCPRPAPRTFARCVTILCTILCNVTH